MPGILSWVLVQEWFAPAKEAVAAVADSAVAVGDGALVPYNAEPIRAKLPVDCHPPFQQKPWESYKAVFPLSMTILTFLARFSVAPIEVTPVVSSLPLAYACPLLP